MTRRRRFTAKQKASVCARQNGLCAECGQQLTCLREGFDALLIEREAAYLADIERRLAYPAGGGSELFGEG